MMKTAGWWLPKGDQYFGKFLANKTPKQNGFQRDHLLEAFKHVKKWDVAIDVGAHVGFWTRDMAERFASVFAFEAAPDTFACLERNMIECGHVIARHAAAGADDGCCQIEEDPSRAGNTGSRFIRAGRGDTPMVSLDGLGFRGCDLLKVDVEGYEWQVLCGAEKLIEAHSPVVIMETDKDFASPRYGVASDAAERFLLDRGYREVAHMRPDKVFVRP